MEDISGTGTLVRGIGDEVFIFLAVIIVGVMSCYVAVRMLLGEAASMNQNLHPDLVPAVQSTRRDMGVAHEESVVPEAENCPVCLGIVENSVQTNCGHRFCAQCVLEYWRHDQWPRPTRCPVCRRTVSLLLGRVADDDLQDQVADYNQRMSGQWRPLWSYLCDVPILLRHLWQELFSDRGPLLIRRLYLVYVAGLLLLYLLSPFDIIPESVFGVIGLLDDLVLLLIAAVYIAFVYRAVLTQRT